MCCWLLRSPMRITCYSLGFNFHAFHPFMAHLPVCFPIYTCAQSSPHCLSNFKDLWAPFWVLLMFLIWLPVFWFQLRLLSRFTCHPPWPWLVSRFSLQSPCWCTLDSLSGLRILSWAYLSATTWFQLAVRPYQLSGALVKKQDGA